MVDGVYNFSCNHFEMNNSLKCIVHGCQNHKHQGSFVGDICTPCYEMITTGKIENHHNFIAELNKKFNDISISTLQQEVMEINKRCREE